MTGSSEGHWDWNLRTGNVFQSPRALQLHGLVEADLALKDPDWTGRMPTHPYDAQRLANAIQRHLEGKTDNFEVEYRVRYRGAPEGDYGWVLTRGRCFRDAAGVPYRIAGSSSDISTRKRAETARHESEQRWQAVFEHSPLGILISRRDGTQMTANPAFGRIVGYSADELAAMSTADITHPDDQARMQEMRTDFMAGTRDFLRTETRYVHKDGRTVWAGLSVVIVGASDGFPAMAVTTVEDITERRNAETERLQLEMQLRQAQKLEAIGTLAGGIAHDFNNILAAILGYGEMAQEVIQHRETRRYVDNVLNAGHRGKALVERILAFSRTGAIARRPFAVEPVVTETCDLLRAGLPTNIHFDMHLAAAAATCVVGDATQMHQIVMNLCTNAIQAMGAGGSLSVSTRRELLDGRRILSNGALDAGEYVVLAVEDTGTGIPATTLERIFDPFYTTKPLGTGTGLGLSLVHGIVNDMAGAINVRTHPGVGTLFELYFPVALGAVPLPVDDTGDAPCGRGETIMLVDDEPTLVALGEETLAELGYEPVGFNSVEAALASFHADPARFDLVITDETMPGTTGTAFAQALTATRPGLPVLLFTGYNTPAILEAARNAGVLAVLNKPLRKRDIGHAIARALGHATVTS
jgi:PAS domain S-box-containing protein